MEIHVVTKQVLDRLYDKHCCNPVVLFTGGECTNFDNLDKYDKVVVDRTYPLNVQLDKLFKHGRLTKDVKIVSTGQVLASDKYKIVNNREPLEW